MISSRIIKREPQKFFEGDYVVGLSFQLWAGIDLKSLLKQNLLNYEKRQLSIVSFKASIDGIVFRKKFFNSEPVGFLNLVISPNG